MILLDTNVISEVWKIAPNARVVAWLNAQPLETLHLSAISVAEIRYGIATMPTGRRRQVYADRMEGEVLPAFSGRILSFDLPASQAYADLMCQARAEGKAVGLADGYIAAIAKANALIVATRDVMPFNATGLPVINPWEE